MYLSMARVKGNGRVTDPPLQEAVRACRVHYREHYGQEADTVLVSVRMDNPPVELDGLPVAAMRWITPACVAVARLGD